MDSDLSSWDWNTTDTVLLICDESAYSQVLSVLTWLRECTLSELVGYRSSRRDVVETWPDLPTLYDSGFSPWITTWETQAQAERYLRNMVFSQRGLRGIACLNDVSPEFLCFFPLRQCYWGLRLLEVCWLRFPFSWKLNLWSLYISYLWFLINSLC